MSNPSAAQAFKFLLEKHLKENLDDPVGEYLIGLINNGKSAVVEASVQEMLPGKGEAQESSAQVQRGIKYLEQTNPGLAEKFFPPKVVAGNPYAHLPNDVLYKEWEWLREYLLRCWESGEAVSVSACRKVIRAAPQTITKWIEQIKTLEGKGERVKQR